MDPTRPRDLIASYTEQDLDRLEHIETAVSVEAIEEALRDGGSVLDAWLQSVVGPELFVRSLRLEGE